MPKFAPTIFALLSLLCFCLSSEARADNIPILGGDAVFADSLFQSGLFSLTNKARGFAVNASAEGLQGGGIYLEKTYHGGDTVSGSFNPLPELGSITIDGLEYRGIDFRANGSPGSIFNFPMAPFTLPPPNPSLPSGFYTVSFTTSFTFTGTLNGYPCPAAGGHCDPAFPTQSLSGQGVATLLFILRIDTQTNFHDYELRRLIYHFGPSTNIVNYSAGRGEQRFAFAISDHGNLLEFESPQNFKHLATREGYALCSTGGPSAFDDGEVDAGWGSSVISQPSGAGTLPLTVTRTTSDGRFELKQSFQTDSNEREVVITMTIKNVSGTTATGVKLSRYFDGDIDTVINQDLNQFFGPFTRDDRYALTSNSVWGWDDGSGARHHGLMLTSLSSAYPDTLAVEKFSDWTSTGAGAQTARTCTPASQKMPTAPGDYVGRLTHNFGAIAAGASKTVKVQYKRM